MKLLILRPEPAAAETEARAAALGLTAVAAPLFVVRPIAWELPEEAVDAVMLTSANAARHGGAGLAALTGLPVFAVGEATAAAARAAGFGDLHCALGDGTALLALLETRRPGRVLHLVGREHVPLDSAVVQIERRVVYGADPVVELPVAARAAIDEGAVVLLHSARATTHLAGLLHDAGIARDAVAIAAISGAVAAAAGPGWRGVAVAATPGDDALLAAAARLCDSRGVG